MRVISSLKIARSENGDDLVQESLFVSLSFTKISEYLCKKVRASQS